MTVAIALSAILGAACVVLVALPFLRDPEPVSDELEEITPERRRRLALAEERDRALSALKELEADHMPDGSTTRITGHRSASSGERRPARCGRSTARTGRSKGMRNESMSMARASVLLAALATVMLVAGTATGDPGSDKARVDARLEETRAKAARAAGTATLLTAELSKLTQATRSAESALASEQARVASLEAALAAEQARLATLGRQVDAQNARLAVVRRQYRTALRVLERHVRAIYLADSPDLISFAVGATSFSELINNLDLLDRIGRQDQRIAKSFDTARIDLARARAATIRTQKEVSRSVAAIAARTAAQRSARDLVASRRDELSAAEGEKAQALEGAREDRATFIAEVEALAA